MRIRALLPVCVALLLANACRDTPPTEPKLEASEAQLSVTAESTTDSTIARSTVCVAYDAELARAAEAGDAAQVAALESIIADACN
jgi:hypothetical protein